jgi:hypothetical protein
MAWKRSIKLSSEEISMTAMHAGSFSAGFDFALRSTVELAQARDLLSGGMVAEVVHAVV